MLKNKKDCVVFCDFDGTISKTDVVDSLFTNFGDEITDKLEEDFRAGIIDDKETLQKKFARIKLYEKQFVEFIRGNIELDEFFKEFYLFTKQIGIEYNIISGGFRNYIDILLKKEGIKEDITVFANQLIFSGERVIPEFLHDIEECHQPFGVCGSCKWEIIKKYKDRGKNIIYIGDSLTDRCPAEEAAYLFAKKDKLLEHYCLENNLDFFPFNNFCDIINVFNGQQIHVQGKQQKGCRK